MATRLRMGPLPKQETIKMTVSLTAELKEELDRYVATYRRLYGQQVDAAMLVPHMLARFMQTDRGYRRASKTPRP